MFWNFTTLGSRRFEICGSRMNGTDFVETHRLTQVFRQTLKNDVYVIEKTYSIQCVRPTTNLGDKQNTSCQFEFDGTSLNTRHTLLVLDDWKSRLIFVRVIIARPSITGLLYRWKATHTFSFFSCFSGFIAIATNHLSLSRPLLNCFAFSTAFNFWRSPIILSLPRPFRVLFPCQRCSDLHSLLFPKVTPTRSDLNVLSTDALHSWKKGKWWKKSLDQL